MNDKPPFPAEGGCACRAVRYRVTTAPLIVHCCHCRCCQRETGTAFALNALFEANRVELTAAAPEAVTIPSHSGKGQQIQRCPTCRIALWSHYAGAGETISFLRVGTLDNPDVCPPDVHIYTEFKQPWVILPTNTPCFDIYYDLKSLWPALSLARLKALPR